MAPTVGCQAKPHLSEGSNEAPERLSDTWADVSLRSNRLGAGVFSYNKRTGRVGESARNFRKLTGDLEDDPSSSYEGTLVPGMRQPLSSRSSELLRIEVYR